jgi:hypothetical protein
VYREDEASPTTRASHDPRRHSLSRKITAASAAIAAMFIEYLGEVYQARTAQH